MALLSLSCYTPVLMARALRPTINNLILKKKWRAAVDETENYFTDVALAA